MHIDLGEIGAMITGKIDENLEARIALQVKTSHTIYEVEFLIDTGFNGHLALPMAMVERCGLKLGEVQRGITADGRESFFDTVRVNRIWDDQQIDVHAQVLDEPLIGTRLLYGYEFHATWIPQSDLKLKKAFT